MDPDLLARLRAAAAEKRATAAEAARLAAEAEARLAAEREQQMDNIARVETIMNDEELVYLQHLGEESDEILILNCIKKSLRYCYYRQTPRFRELYWDNKDTFEEEINIPQNFSFM